MIGQAVCLWTQLWLLSVGAPGVVDTPSVAVVAEGKSGSAAASQVARALLDRDVDVVSNRDYASQARRAGVDKRRMLTGRGIQRVSQAAGLAGVIHVKVTRKRRKRYALVKFYDAEGSLVVSIKGKLGRSGRLRSKDLRRLASAAERSAPAAEEAYAQAPSDSSGDDPSNSSYGGDSDSGRGASNDGSGSNTAAGDGSLASSDYSDSGDSSYTPGWLNSDTSRVSAEASPPRRKRSDDELPLISFQVVGGLGLRNHVAMLPDKTAAVPPYRVKRKPFPEAGLRLQLAPLRGYGRLAEGLGLELAGTYAFLSSRVQAEDGSQLSKNKTPVQRLHVDARYSIQIPGSSWLPSVGLRAGWGLTSFKDGQAEDEVLSVARKSLRVGGELRQPIYAPYLSLDVWCVYMPMMWTGKEEVAVFGPHQKTRGLAMRFGLSGGTDGRGTGFTWTVYLDWIEHADVFGPNPNQGLTVATQERYIVAGLGLGYAY